MITSYTSYVTQNSPGCRYWTWHHKGAGEYAFRCVVMDDILNTAPDSNAVSGAVRSCFSVFSTACALVFITVSTPLHYIQSNILLRSPIKPHSLFPWCSHHMTIVPSTPSATLPPSAPSSPQPPQFTVQTVSTV